MVTPGTRTCSSAQPEAQVPSCSAFSPSGESVGLLAGRPDVFDLARGRISRHYACGLRLAWDLDISDLTYH